MMNNLCITYKYIIITGGNKTAPAPPAGRAAGGGALGRERPLPRVRHQVYAYYAKTSLVYSYSLFLVMYFYDF